MKKKYEVIDKALAFNDNFKSSLFNLKYPQIIAKISRMAYDKFGANNPRECRNIVEYICENHVPNVLLNVYNNLK